MCCHIEIRRQLYRFEESQAYNSSEPGSYMMGTSHLWFSVCKYQEGAYYLQDLGIWNGMYG